MQRRVLAFERKCSSLEFQSGKTERSRCNEGGGEEGWRMDKKQWKRDTFGCCCSLRDQTRFQYLVTRTSAARVRIGVDSNVLLHIRKSCKQFSPARCPARAGSCPHPQQHCRCSLSGSSSPAPTPGRWAPHALLRCHEMAVINGVRGFRFEIDRCRMMRVV